jgi:ABC-type multidrug transport system ATPase subunit
MANRVLVELEGLRFRYRSASGWAIDDLTLRIERGTVLGLIGPNGSGKTTLFRLLLGFLQPMAGRVSVGGIAPAKYRISYGVGYLPEQVRMPGNVRVREFAILMARLARLPASSLEPTLDRLMRGLALADKSDSLIGRLSHGYRQRVGLLAALLGESELVLLDEPANGLDPSSMGVLRSVVRALKRRGRTVVVSSHNLFELERVCDEILILREGRLLELCTRENLVARPDVWVVQLRALRKLEGGCMDGLCANLDGVRLATDEAGFADGRRAREFARRVSEAGAAVETIERRAFDLEYLFHSSLQRRSSDGGNDA